MCKFIFKSIAHSLFSKILKEAFGDDAELIEDLQYQDVVDGPLLLQVDKVIDLIFTKYFKALVDCEGVQRTETNMLTRGIVRELLLNAINHKDYATGVPI